MKEKTLSELLKEKYSDEVFEDVKQFIEEILEEVEDAVPKKYTNMINVNDVIKIIKQKAGGSLL